jgi:outer membrane protein TolC
MVEGERASGLPYRPSQRPSRRISSISKSAAKEARVRFATPSRPLRPSRRSLASRAIIFLNLHVSSFCVFFLALFLSSPALAQTDSESSPPPPTTPGSAIPGTGASAPFSSSVPMKPVAGVLPLSLQDAITFSLKQNLGLLLSTADVGNARGQRWQQLSALLPHAEATPFIDISKINLNEEGLSSLGPIHVPAGLGPYSYFDARAGVTLSVFDWKSINAARAAGQNLKSAQFTQKDARDLVVLAVGYTYLQAVADQARIDTAQAQVDTAKALHDQASDQLNAGTSPEIDELRAKVELQTRQQQLIQAQNDFAIQKLAVARVVGLAPGQEFDLTDKSPYQEFQGLNLDEALKRAYSARSDYQAAMSDLHAAEFLRKAAIAGYFPSLSFSANYGIGGFHTSDATQVGDVRGTLTIPLFTGGQVHGDILQADARLDQAHERLDSLRAQIDADVRSALLNLQSLSERVAVAKSNIDLADRTLAQSRDRFSAGVTDTVEVVQSQELVASAHEQYISSLYNYNFARISLARALGVAEQGVKEYFKGQ